MKHAHHIIKKYDRIKYILGLLLLLIIIIIVLFFRSKEVVAPQEEVTDNDALKQAINNDWRCPANAWVNCEPNNESKECNDEYLKWALSQCEGFQGAAY